MTDEYNTRCEDSLAGSFQINSNMVVRLEEDFRRIPELLGREVAPAPTWQPLAPVAESEPTVQLGLF